SLLQLATVEHSRGLREQSEQTAGKAGDIYRELQPLPPPNNNRYDPLLLAATVNILALAQRERGALENAVKLHDDSIKLLNGLYNNTSESVNNADVLHFLACFQVEKCRTWIFAGKRPAATENNLGVAIQTWEALHAKFPQVPMYQENQAM